MQLQAEGYVRETAGHGPRRTQAIVRLGNCCAASRSGRAKPASGAPRLIAPVVSRTATYNDRCAGPVGSQRDGVSIILTKEQKS